MVEGELISVRLAALRGELLIAEGLTGAAPPEAEREVPLTMDRLSLLQSALESWPPVADYRARACARRGETENAIAAYIRLIRRHSPEMSAVLVHPCTTTGLRSCTRRSEKKTEPLRSTGGSSPSGKMPTGSSRNRPRRGGGSRRSRGGGEGAPDARGEGIQGELCSEPRRMRARYVLLEQELAELVQVLPPVLPFVRAGGFAVDDVESALPEELHRVPGCGNEKSSLPVANQNVRNPFRRAASFRVFACLSSHDGSPAPGPPIPPSSKIPS